jgi:hypothetical protein
MILRDEGDVACSKGVGNGFGLFAVSTTTMGGVGEALGLEIADGRDGVERPDGFDEFRFLAISESLKKLSAATLSDNAAAQQARISILLEILGACWIFSPHRVQKVDSSGIFIPHFEQNTGENLSGSKIIESKLAATSADFFHFTFVI